MILREMSLLIIMSIVACSALVGWTSAIFFGPDNNVEEEMEMHIRRHTGLHVDLTPSTPEKK